jgi:hypothetical protein
VKKENPKLIDKHIGDEIRETGEQEDANDES